ncbi:MAG: glycosyltransferase family 2 protein, partial [Pseudomonadota bacterium]
MNGRPSVSIVIPSRGRPYLVPVILNALRYLTYPVFEVILVGEAEAADAYEISPDLRKAIHYLPCHTANISAARNLGIRAARGEIVAFIDDDAVPEPDWLDQLVVPFADERVGAAGGRVRDRDGVRCQFDGATFDRGAEETPLAASENVDGIWAPRNDRVLAMMGTNCAFRRSALMALGGFDESYRYFLDETDVLLRMAEAGWHFAWVPGAEVHHLSDQNGMRGKNREPRDPYELGASRSYFSHRHTPEGNRDACMKTFRARMSRDLDHHIRLGTITGAERDYLIARLELGIQDGMLRQPKLPLIAGGIERVILPLQDRIPEARLSFAVLGGRSMAMLIKTEKIARGLVTRGHRVSLFISRSGGQSRSVRFVDGLWVHEGPSISQRA